MTETETKSKGKLGLNLFMVVAGLSLLVVIGWSGCSFVGGITYSDGERTGAVTKFSHKGMFTKTWEGELTIPAPSGTTAVPEKWYFSVNADAESNGEKVVDLVQKAQRSGKIHTLHYKQRMWKNSFKGQTTYFIVDVNETGE